MVALLVGTLFGHLGQSLWSQISTIRSLGATIGPGLALNIYRQTAVAMLFIRRRDWAVGPYHTLPQ